MVHIGADSQRPALWQLDEPRYWIRSRPPLAITMLKEVIFNVPRFADSAKRNLDHSSGDGEYCNILIRMKLQTGSVRWQLHPYTCRDCIKIAPNDDDLMQYLHQANGDKATKLIRFITALKADLGNDPAPTTTR